MKSIYILLLFFSISIFGQKFPDELSENYKTEVCNCLSNSPQKNLDILGSCVDNWLNKYSGKFNKYIDFNSKTDPREQFNSIAKEFMHQNRENIIVNCDDASRIFENLKYQFYETDKKNYDSIDLSELNKAVKTDKSALLTRAKYYFYHDDLDKAEADFIEVLKSDPNEQKAIYFLGILNERKGNYQKAIDYYNQLVALTHDETFLSDIYLVKAIMKRKN